MNSITKRWIWVSLVFMLAVLLLAEFVFLYFMITGYYTGTAEAMLSRLEAVESQLELSAGEADEQVAMQRIVQQFEEKALFELMLVNDQGAIVTTSSGVMPRQDSVPADVADVLEYRREDYGEVVERNEYGEKVMAVTRRIAKPTGSVVAVRLVTSLGGIDGAIRNLVIASLLFLLVIVLAYVASGLYFIRSIVIPLHSVEATAARIARGDFETRISYESDDEIGSLCRTINNMAGELDRAEQMKNEFISSVSHELRTPLTSIKGWVETVGNMDSQHDANYQRGMEIISSETDRLYGMVEELLDFSRMQSGMELHPELLDLAAEVEDAVLIVLKRAEGLGLFVDYEAPEQPVPVAADKNRVRQALVNVLDNAIKYSFAGGHIVLTVTQRHGQALVNVQDEGSGIAPEDLQNVKQRFYKGKGAVRGSGIGLAVVDEVMNAHEGSFEIESEPGSGTVVKLCFPLK